MHCFRELVYALFPDYYVRMALGLQGRASQGTVRMEGLIVSDTLQVQVDLGKPSGLLIK